MNEFWQGKQVVVTGGAGMVGGFLCPMLIERGASVIILSRSSPQTKGARWISGDAGDVQVCKRAFAGTFAVFNLAASVGGVYFNVKNQSDQLWANLRLQMMPVIAAQQCGIENFLQVSSVCVYADEYNNPAVEENGHLGEPRPANAGYAWAKRFGEIATHLVFQGSPTKYVIVRPTNMYGEGDNFGAGSHVIPSLIKKFVGHREDSVVVYNGDNSREFMHAEDGARGMIEAMQKGQRGETYNLGTSGETQVSISALARIIRHLSGSQSEIILANDGVAGDEHRYTDCCKAQRDFGWAHSINLQTGLGRTIEHYRSQVLAKNGNLW